MDFTFFLCETGPDCAEEAQARVIETLVRILDQQTSREVPREINETKLQKQSAIEVCCRIISHRRVYNTPQLTAESVSKAFFGLIPRDFALYISDLKMVLIFLL